MSSLKSFTPVLAKALLIAPAALYERQRVLARDGVLVSHGNRGPGSGVRLTSQSVATVIISAMVNVSAVDISTITKTFLNLRPDKADRSSGRVTLCDELASAVAGNSKVARGDLVIECDAKRAVFWIYKGNTGTNFRCPESFRPIHGLQTSVTLPAESLRIISKQFQQTLNASSD